MGSSVNAMSVSKFAGALSSQKGGAEQEKAVLCHLCASHLGEVATEVMSVEQAASLGVERLQAGGLAPSSFSQFMAGIYNFTKQMREAIHERTAWLVASESNNGIGDSSVI